MIDPGHRPVARHGPVTGPHAHAGAIALSHAAIRLGKGGGGECERYAGDDAGDESVSPFHGASPIRGESVCPKGLPMVGGGSLRNGYDLSTIV